MNRKQRRQIGRLRYGRGEVRAVPDAPEGTVDVTAVAYGVVDDYGSLWLPGVFARSLGERMPTFAWAHDWTEPIGRGIEHADADDGQHVRLRLDLQRDPETRQPIVPRAHQTWSQIDSGTLDDVSVGFWPVTVRQPTAEEVERYPGVQEVMVDADLDEISVVLRGAVPGAKIGAFRDARGQQVPEASVVDIAKKVAAGELTEAEGKAALGLLATDDGVAPPPEQGDGGTGDDGAADAVLAEADAALDALGDRSRR